MWLITGGRWSAVRSSALLQKIKTGTLLGYLASRAAGMHEDADQGTIAMWSVFWWDFFQSIMFPSIYTLGIRDSTLKGDGSGLMIMAIVGGTILLW